MLIVNGLAFDYSEKLAKAGYFKVKLERAHGECLGIRSR
jgi:hypothetical protein